MRKMLGAKKNLMKKLLPLTLMFLMLVAFACPVRSEQSQSKQSFAAFWTQFKAAVAKDNKEAVAAMTRFPVDISANVTKDEFLKKYHQFFSKDVRKCFAKEKPIGDDQSRRGGYNLFCGSDIFTFERVDGEYKLTSIGVND
jgi:hypothetical protein